MHEPELIYEAFRREGVRLVTGVPDSLLKDFCAYVTDHAADGEHVIAANEGSAVALAVGHFLGSGSPALVYLQNSGLGNTVNPLLSLADREVYNIPMLLLIGWRGEPGVKDEPQHVKQGRVTPSVLDAMEIPWFLLDTSTDDPAAVVAEAAARMRTTMAPVALLVRKGTFHKYTLVKKVVTDFAMNREAAIECLLESLVGTEMIVSTTGMASRELYEYRDARSETHGRDFLTVGGMGHAASIAMGLAQTQPQRRIICLDGDGSVIMHMGALAVIGQSGLKNLSHIVINNGAHDSVGGQPTVALDIDLTRIAEACGYRRAVSVSESAELSRVYSELSQCEGPLFLEIRVNRGARVDLGRPRSSPIENRDALMNQLGVAFDRYA